MAVLFLVVGVVLLLSFFNDESQSPSMSKKEVQQDNDDSTNSSVENVGSTYIEYRIVYKGVEYKATNREFSSVEDFYNYVKTKYNDTLSDDKLTFDNATTLADYGLFTSEPMPNLSSWAVKWEDTGWLASQRDYAAQFIQLCKECLSLLQSRDGFFPKKIDKRLIKIGETYFVYLDDLMTKVNPMFDFEKGTTGMVLAIKFVYYNDRLSVFVDNGYIANLTTNTRSWFKRLAKELRCNDNSQSIVYHLYKFDFFCEFPIELVDVENDEKQVSE